MGLLKGSKIKFTDAEAIIAGDTIITPELAPEMPAPAMELAELSGVVPRAPERSAPDEWEQDLGELVGVVAEAEPEPARAQPVMDYEEVRSHLIGSAEDAAELDAAPYIEQLEAAATDLMEQRLGAAQQTLVEAYPDGDFGRVLPYVQRQVVAELELEHIGTVNEIRWTHLKRIEDKIVSEAAEVAADIEPQHPPESFAELIAQREAILSEARLEAERLVMAAQTHAAAMVAQAEQAQAQTMLELESERERILQEMREQALEQGYEEGKAAGEQQAAQYIQEALLKLNEIMIAFPQAVKMHEQNLVTMALEIAGKVIQEEVSLQPEIVQRTVETALRRVSDLEQVVVKVNPLDLDLILPKQDTFRMLVPDVQNFSIEGSHTIQRGGCIIETNSGSINATIATQLSIVEEVFKNVQAEYDDLGE